MSKENMSGEEKLKKTEINKNKIMELANKLLKKNGGKEFSLEERELAILSSIHNYDETPKDILNKALNICKKIAGGDKEKLDTIFQKFIAAKCLLLKKDYVEEEDRFLFLPETKVYRSEEEKKKFIEDPKWVAGKRKMLDYKDFFDAFNVEKNVKNNKESLDAEIPRDKKPERKLEGTYPISKDYTKQFLPANSDGISASQSENTRYQGKKKSDDATNGYTKAHEDRFGASIIQGDLSALSDAEVMIAVSSAIEELSQEVKDMKSGATLTGNFVCKGKVFTYSVGDSGSVLVSEAKTVKLGVEHDCDLRDDFRYACRGGKVKVDSFSPRLSTLDEKTNFGLSRAIGDGIAKAVDGGSIMSNQGQFTVKPTGEDEKLFMFSDAVTEVMSYKEIADVIKSTPAGEDPATYLKQEAIRRGTEDNITVVVVDPNKFKNPNEALFCFVADGHGGSEVANHIQKNLPTKVAQKLAEVAKKEVKVGEMGKAETENSLADAEKEIIGAVKKKDSIDSSKDVLEKGKKIPPKALPKKPATLEEKREAVKDLLGKSGISLDDYLRERIAGQRQKMQEDQQQTNKEVVDKIKDGKKFVVIPARSEDQASLNTDNMRALIDSSLAALGKEKSDNYFYLNNPDGGAKAGHWDLVQGGKKEIIKTSTKGLSCGFYTVLQAVGSDQEMATNLQEVLRLVTAEDSRKIQALFNEKDETKRIEGINNADAGLVRRFAAAAIQNYLEVEGNVLSEEVKKSLVEKRGRFLQENYQIEAEELEDVFKGLGVPYLRASDLQALTQDFSAEEKAEREKTIIENILAKKDDEIDSLQGFVKEGSKLANVLKGIDDINSGISSSKEATEAAKDEMEKEIKETEHELEAGKKVKELGLEKTLELAKNHNRLQKTKINFSKDQKKLYEDFLKFVKEKEGKSLDQRKAVFEALKAKNTEAVKEGSKGREVFDLLFDVVGNVLNDNKIPEEAKNKFLDDFAEVFVSKKSGKEIPSNIGDVTSMLEGLSEKYRKQEDDNDKAIFGHIGSAIAKSSLFSDLNKITEEVKKGLGQSEDSNKSEEDFKKDAQKISDAVFTVFAAAALIGSGSFFPVALVAVVGLYVAKSKFLDNKIGRDQQSKGTKEDFEKEAELERLKRQQEQKKLQQQQKNIESLENPKSKLQALNGEISGLENRKKEIEKIEEAERTPQQIQELAEIKGLLGKKQKELNDFIKPTDPAVKKPEEKEKIDAQVEVLQGKVGGEKSVDIEPKVEPAKEPDLIPVVKKDHESSAKAPDKVLPKLEDKSVKINENDKQRKDLADKYNLHLPEKKAIDPEAIKEKEKFSKTRQGSFEI